MPVIVNSRCLLSDARITGVASSAGGQDDKTHSVLWRSLLSSCVGGDSVGLCQTESLPVGPDEITMGTAWCARQRWPAASCWVPDWISGSLQQRWLYMAETGGHSACPVQLVSHCVHQTPAGGDYALRRSRSRTAGVHRCILCADAQPVRVWCWKWGWRHRLQRMEIGSKNCFLAQRVSDHRSVYIEDDSQPMRVGWFPMM